MVNWNLEVVYDTFVMPERSIVDYNTRYFVERGKTRVGFGHYLREFKI